MHKAFLFLLIMILQGNSFAQSSSGTMSEEARAGQKIQNPLYPQMQLPLAYNFNPKMGFNNGTQQTELSFNPIIPVSINSDVQLILNPMLTYNHNANDQQITNQSQPIQLATFFAPTYAKKWYFGIGPYIQAPATNANNGSKQTGLGVSAGAFFTPDHWVVGAAMFNSWGVGNDLSGGKANLLNIQPSISYITNNAWIYNLSNQLVYNYTPSFTTNQMTLSAGKTIRFGDYHLQFQAGPTYMLTSTPSSSKGFGAFFGLTLLLPR